MFRLIIFAIFCLVPTSIANKDVCQSNGDPFLKVGFVKAELFSYYRKNNETIFYGKDVGLLNYLSEAMNFQYE